MQLLLIREFSIFKICKKAASESLLVGFCCCSDWIFHRLISFFCFTSKYKIQNALTNLCLTPKEPKGGLLQCLRVASVGPGLGTPPESPHTPVQSAGSCRGEAPGTSEGYSGVKPHWGIHSRELRSGQTLRQRRAADHSAGLWLPR